jgi:DNA-binding NtrC family response regulator
VEVWKKNRHKIDLLFTDMVMPGGLSGKELSQLILQEDPKIRVLITSGYSPESVRMEGELASHFLQKPYNPIALLGALRKALDEDQTEHQPSLPFKENLVQSTDSSQKPEQ